MLREYFKIFASCSSGNAPVYGEGGFRFKSRAVQIGHSVVLHLEFAGADVAMVVAIFSPNFGASRANIKPSVQLHSGGSCLFETGGQQIFFFCDIVQSLFASFVLIYKMKLFLVGQGQSINFSLHINLFLRLLRCFVTVT